MAANTACIVPSVAGNNAQSAGSSEQDVNVKDCEGIVIAVGSDPPTMPTFPSGGVLSAKEAALQSSKTASVANQRKLFIIPRAFRTAFRRSNSALHESNEPRTPTIRTTECRGSVSFSQSESSTNSPAVDTFQFCS